IEDILANHKPVILVANKSDLAQAEIPEHRKWLRGKVASELRFFSDIPVVFISAKTGAGVKELFEKIESLWEKLHIKLSTSELNNFFYETIRKAPAPVYGTKDVKFYYLTQTHQKPPS